MNAHSTIARPVTAAQLLGRIQRTEWAVEQADQRCVRSHREGDEKAEALWSDAMPHADARLAEQREQLQDLILDKLGVTFDQLRAAGL